MQTLRDMEMPASAGFFAVPSKVVHMIKNRLKHWRHMKEMNQKEFAAFLGYHQSQINRWEAQKQQPSIEACFRISKRLEVPIEHLFEPPE